jgi:hypothetical protein
MRSSVWGSGGLNVFVGVEMTGFVSVSAGAGADAEVVVVVVVVDDVVVGNTITG